MAAGEARLARSPVRIPSRPFNRRYSIPSSLHYSTRTESRQRDDPSGLPSNRQTDYGDDYGGSETIIQPLKSAGWDRRRANSAHNYGESRRGKGTAYAEVTGRRGSNHHAWIGVGDVNPSLLLPSTSSSSSDASSHRSSAVSAQQLLKHRGKTPVSGVDSAALGSNQHVSPSTPSGFAHPGNLARYPAAFNCTRRVSVPGDMTAWQRPAGPGSSNANTHVASPSPGGDRRRRRSISTISQSPKMNLLPSTRSKAAVHAGGTVRGGLVQQSRSLPDEGELAKSLSGTRKKNLSSNVSQEYVLAMDGLRVSGEKQQGQPKRLLSKKWSSIQSSVLNNNRAVATLPRRDQGELETASVRGEIAILGGGGTHGVGGASAAAVGGKPGRGWAIARANLMTIAAMAPRDSIDSKPLSFKNIADLVKAKEFRLMVKRRASFVENGRFQFEEAKQDLYRRYGPADGAKTPNSSARRGRTKAGATRTTATKSANRRKQQLGLAGSV